MVGGVAPSVQDPRILKHHGRRAYRGYPALGLVLASKDCPDPRILPKPVDPGSAGKEQTLEGVAFNGGEHRIGVNRQPAASGHMYPIAQGGRHNSRSRAP